MPDRFNEISSEDEDIPVAGFAYNFLCEERIIRGTTDLNGLVYIGDENGKDANILWALDDFRYHCTTCRAVCIQDQKEEIIGLFKTGKFEGTI